MRLLWKIVAVVLPLLSTHELRAQPVLCNQYLSNFLANAPSEVEAGVAHVHLYRLNPNDPGMVVSILAPSPKGFPNAKVMDLVQHNFNTPWPQRFVLSDGYPSGDFLYVDISAGSPLKLEITRFLDEMKKNGLDARTNHEGLLRDLAVNMNRNFGSQDPYSLAAAGQGVVNHPGNYVLDANSAKVFSDFQGKGIGPAVFDLGQKKRVVPFEFFFAPGACKVCIHKSLWASLILQEVGIPHKMIAGFSSRSGPSYANLGHSMIELADGRILDPSWSSLGPKVYHPQDAQWIQGGGGWWTPNSHFPYLVLE